MDWTNCSGYGHHLEIPVSIFPAMRFVSFSPVMEKDELAFAIVIIQETEDTMSNVLEGLEFLSNPPIFSPYFSATTKAFTR